jgi:hypothetical protein
VIAPLGPFATPLAASRRLLPERAHVLQLQRLHQAAVPRRPRRALLPRRRR